MTDFEHLPPLRKWMIFGKYFTKTKDYTHLLLDNGKLQIPDAKIAEFHKLYAEDIKNKRKHYICEIRTKIFRLFFDLDFHEVDPEALSDERVYDYIQTIQAVISEFFQESDKHVIVCTTDSKKVEKEGVEYNKTGIHLIWPNLFVSQQTALLLRMCMIQFLEKKYGSRPSYSSWADVVDLSVFDKNGLRMIGSRKMGPCPVCRNSKEKKCNKPNCVRMFDDSRKLDEGRPYMPWSVVDENGKPIKKELNRLQKTFNYTVEQTTIRTNRTSESKHQAPVWFLMTEEIIQPKPNSKARKKPVFPSKEDLVGMKEMSVRQRIFDNDIRFVKTKDFLRSHFFDCYKKTVITDLFLCDGYYVASTNSKFCKNIDREHNSNHIYFYINKGFMFQKCFCRCDPKPKHQSCRKYRSPGKPLGEQLTTLLFPEMRQETLKSQDFEEYTYKLNESEQLDNILTHLENKLS